MSPSYHTLQKYKSIIFWWCLLMLKNDILLNLFIEYCMFITSTTKNLEKCSTTKLLIIIGHYHMLGKTWLMVLVGHPHHSPPFALHSNLNPNGFLYPVPNPSTQSCWTLQQQYVSCQLQMFFNKHFFTSKIQRLWNETCQCIWCLFFSLISNIIIHGMINTSICRHHFGHPSHVSYDLVIHLSPQLRVTYNNLPYIKHYFPQVLVSSDYAPNSPQTLAQWP